MTKEQIVEKNKKIAEFMGWINTTHTDSQVSIYEHRNKEKAPNGMYLVDQWTLNYHKSWDWLMPVIQKLYKIDLIWTQYEDTIRAALPYEGIEDIHAKVYKWILAVEKFNEGLV